MKGRYDYTRCLLKHWMDLSLSLSLFRWHLGFCSSHFFSPSAVFHTIQPNIFILEYLHVSSNWCSFHNLNRIGQVKSSLLNVPNLQFLINQQYNLIQIHNGLQHFYTLAILCQTAFLLKLSLTPSTSCSFLSENYFPCPHISGTELIDSALGVSSMASYASKSTQWKTCV